MIVVLLEMLVLQENLKIILIVYIQFGLQEDKLHVLVVLVVLNVLMIQFIQILVLLKHFQSFN